MVAQVSGRELLALDNEDLARKVRDAVIARAVRARHCPFTFAEFVMRAEHTRKPIKLAPHQKVFIQFVMDHARSVCMLPVGHSKTFLMACLTLYMLGRDPTGRGVIVCSEQGQAKKVLAVVRDYIETSAELRMVFPALMPSRRPGDEWSQTKITIERPPGIKDASLFAVGFQGGDIVGSRLNWIIIDDILTMENTSTKEQRDKVCDWVDNTVLSRLDVRSQVIVTNTAWHPEDLPHRLEARGWGTLRMDAHGLVHISDDRERILEAEFKNIPYEPWDCEWLRPSGDVYNGPCRLVGRNDQDPLWPEERGWRWLEARQRDHHPQRYNQLYRQICRDDESSQCKVEWIEACQKRAQQLGIHSFVHEKHDNPLTFTGVDLAVQKGEHNDETALFTFEVLPDGSRRILDIDIGRYDGPTVMRKLKDIYRRYRSVIRVENNGAQDFLIQFMLADDMSMPIERHCTTSMKAHPEFGVQGLFIELKNGAWLIPTSPHGNVHPNIRKWIDACLYYSPANHTADVLMATYFAREQAREWGALVPQREGAGDGANIGMSIMAR